MAIVKKFSCAVDRGGAVVVVLEAYNTAYDAKKEGEELFELMSAHLPYGTMKALFLRWLKEAEEKPTVNDYVRKALWESIIPRKTEEKTGLQAAIAEILPHRTPGGHPCRSETGYLPHIGSDSLSAECITCSKSVKRAP